MVPISIIILCCCSITMFKTLELSYLDCLWSLAASRCYICIVLTEIKNKSGFVFFNVQLCISPNLHDIQLCYVKLSKCCYFLRFFNVMRYNTRSQMGNCNYTRGKCIRSIFGGRLSEMWSKIRITFLCTSWNTTGTI